MRVGTERRRRMEMYALHSRGRPEIRRPGHIHVGVRAWKIKTTFRREKKKEKQFAILVTGSVLISVVPFRAREFLSIAFVQLPGERHLFRRVLPSAESRLERTTSFHGHEHYKPIRRLRDPSGGRLTFLTLQQREFRPRMVRRLGAADFHRLSTKPETICSAVYFIYRTSYASPLKFFFRYTTAVAREFRTFSRNSEPTAVEVGERYSAVPTPSKAYESD